MPTLTTTTALDPIDGYSEVDVSYTTTQVTILGDGSDIIMSLGRVYLPELIDMLATELARFDATQAAKPSEVYVGTQKRVITSAGNFAFSTSLSSAASTVLYTTGSSGESLSISHSRDVLALLQQV